MDPLKRFGAPRKSSPVYDLRCLSAAKTKRYDKLPNTIEKAAFLTGPGQQKRPTYDCPSFNELHGKEVVLGGPKKGAGNAWIVLGLDRTGFMKGFATEQASHCAAVDIVAGRQGFTAASHEIDGTPILVDPNFNDDAARVYLSQRCEVDAAFGFERAKSSPPRSTVAAKADTIRLIARENIKFITRTDELNSQGGALGDAWKGGYGIDLIACNDLDTLQPMVKGDNLVSCLDDIIDMLIITLSIVNTYTAETQKLHSKLLPHDHMSPFYANPTAPDFKGIIPEGMKVIINNVCDATVALQQGKLALTQLKTTYLKSTGVEATEKGTKKSMHILSPYNSNN
jgi:hypothetical protein